MNSCNNVKFNLKQEDFFDNETSIEQKYFYEKYYGKSIQEISRILADEEPIMFMHDLFEQKTKICSYYFLALALFMFENINNRYLKPEVDVVFSGLPSLLSTKLDKCMRYEHFHKCIIKYIKWSILYAPLPYKEKYKKLDKIIKGLIYEKTQK